MYHPAHFVKFTTDLEGDGTLDTFDALVPGHVSAGQTLPLLYVFQNGQLEKKTDVPHGSEEQGDTWH